MHADRREPESMSAAHRFSCALHRFVARREERILYDSEHAGCLIKERREFCLPIGDVAPLRIFEVSLRWHVESIGVDKRATTDASTSEHKHVFKEMDSLNAIETESRIEKKVAQSPRVLREILVFKSATSFDDADAVTLLSQSECRDTAAET